MSTLGFAVPVGCPLVLVDFRIEEELCCSVSISNNPMLNSAEHLSKFKKVQIAANLSLGREQYTHQV